MSEPLVAGVHWPACEHGNERKSCVVCERNRLRAEVKRLETALGLIAELGERCEECDDIDPTVGRMATYETRHTLTGLPITLCDVHAAETIQAHRKAVSKGCGPQPDVEPFEQDTAVQIALGVLHHGTPTEGT